MVLEDVDLGCKRCHKNIKKLLNKIPGESLINIILWLRAMLKG